MASTLLVNTIDTQSGSTISIPTGKTLAIVDAGGLTVAGTTIESGNVSVNVITGSSTDLGTGSEVAMWTSKNKAIFMVDASGGAKTIQLPAPGATGRSTVSIVIACSASSAIASTVSPNTVTINNSSAAEVFTLYAKGDYVEFVSDGTTDFRTGNEHISAGGTVHRTGNESVTQGSTENIFQASEFNVDHDWGDWFDDSTNLRVVVPYDCRIQCSCLVYTQNTGAHHMTPSIRRYYNSNASNEYLWRADNHTGSPTGLGNYNMLVHDFLAGDEIQFEAYNLHDTSAYTMPGGANLYSSAYGRWNVLRRW